MAANTAPNSIWKQMDYTPPRGPCNHKDSLLAPRCPCLRFMLHPLKISSSFTCDGCDHHASFHNMASPADDAIIARWEKENEEKQVHQKRKANGQLVSGRKRRQLLNGLASMDIHTERACSDNVNNDRRAIEWNVDAANSRRARSASPASEASDTGAGAADGLRTLSNSSRTWGERFTSWSFGNVEPEPQKTPPKKSLQIPAARSTGTTTESQGSKAGRRIAVPKPQITVKKLGRPKKASAAGLGKSIADAIPVSDTEHPD